MRGLPPDRALDRPPGTVIGHDGPRSGPKASRNAGSLARSRPGPAPPAPAGHGCLPPAPPASPGPRRPAGHWPRWPARVPASSSTLRLPLDLPSALGQQRLAVAGEIPQLPDRLGRHERGTDQPVLDQLADPHRVSHIRLAARDVLEVLSIQQPHLEVGLQQVLDRLPIDPGRLHPDQRDPKLASQSPAAPTCGGGPNVLVSVRRPPWSSGTRTVAEWRLDCRRYGGRALLLYTTKRLRPGLAHGLAEPR
jgi:hypothetical protein